MPALSEILPLVLLLVAIGGVAGVIAGLLGVGGGIILVPAFYYAFTSLGYHSDQLMQVCIATSLATIIVTSVRSVVAHDRKGAVDWDVLRSWAPGIGIGAVAGVLIVSLLHTTALQGIFGLLALVVALYLGFGHKEWRIADRMPVGPVRAVLSVVVGFLSVLMGIGGGSFGVPLMTLHNMPIHRAVATASGFGVTIAAPSVIVFLLLRIADAPPYTMGAVSLPAFAVVIVSTYVTTTWGVSLAHRTDPGPLRKIFAAFLALVALNMLRKALGY